MRILLLAPHPFYQERGTPIAVNLLARAMAERGDVVDILTYHEGETLSYPSNITIHRIPPQRFASHIRPGFSLKKIICDIALYRSVARMMQKTSYDCIHAVEESVFIAKRFSKKQGIPYVFDMDSSMPQQIADKLPIAKCVLPLMKKIETSAIRNAVAVVPMCSDLAEYAKSVGAKYVEILHDISLLPEKESPNSQNGFREQLNISKCCMLYLGNLEPYQGIDLMLESLAIATQSTEDIHLVVAGGRADDIQKYKLKSRQLGIEPYVNFIGPRPIDHMAALFKDADILISPRTQGNNTPMKIYSYLDAQRAIIATDLPTHTQVLDHTTAELVQPTPRAMAMAMLRLSNDEALRKELATNAKKTAIEKYSHQAFKATVNRLYDTVAAIARANNK